MDPQGLKFLTRLCLGHSLLNAHRFRHIFQDCLNSLCSCSLKLEDMSPYRNNFDSMFDNVKNNVLLYSDSSFDEVKIRYMLEATITYMTNSEQFSGSLFD